MQEPVLVSELQPIPMYNADASHVRSFIFPRLSSWWFYRRINAEDPIELAR